MATKRFEGTALAAETVGVLTELEGFRQEPLVDRICAVLEQYREDELKRTNPMLQHVMENVKHAADAMRLQRDIQDQYEAAKRRALGQYAPGSWKLGGDGWISPKGSAIGEQISLRELTYTQPKLPDVKQIHAEVTLPREYEKEPGALAHIAENAAHTMVGELFKAGYIKPTELPGPLGGFADKHYRLTLNVVKP